MCVGACVCMTADSVVTFGACSRLGRPCDVSNASTPIAIPYVRSLNGSVVNTSTWNITKIGANDAVSAVLAGGSGFALWCVVLSRCVYCICHVLLTADGRLYTWGACSSYLGRTCDGSGDPTPIEVGGDLIGHNITDVIVGTQHVLVIADGMLFGFGKCNTGALGINGSTCGIQTSPVLIPIYNDTLNYTVTGAGVGTSHSIVLAGGVVFTLGQCSSGQLGYPCPVNGSTFTGKIVSGLPAGEITAVFAGGDVSAVIIGECNAVCCDDVVFN